MSAWMGIFLVALGDAQQALSSLGHSHLRRPVAEHASGALLPEDAQQPRQRTREDAANGAGS